MKFAELLRKFQHEIDLHYGPGCDITKIAINRKLMRRIQADVYKMYPHMEMNGIFEATILGIPLYVREKDDF